MTVTICDDKDFFNKMVQKIKENNGYCLCELEKTEDTKCWCKAFREQGPGLCNCGLYKKIEK